MNIVIANDNAHVNGGAAKLAILEAVGLADRGHDVFFLSALAPVDDRLSQHTRIKVICTGQHDLLSHPNRLQAFAQGWWNAEAARAMCDLLAGLDSRDTVVHLHIWSRALSPSVLDAALNTRLPTVCTLHDFLLACPTGTFFLHPEQAICKLKPMSAACICTNCDARSYAQKLWRVGRQVVQNRVVQAPRRIQDFVVHSSLAWDVMRPNLPSNARVHAVTPYIESERHAPADAGANSGFVYLGRLVREKGVTMMARAAASEAVPLKLVGTGPLEEEVRQAYPQAAITGWVDYQTSLSFLRKARALVFPSLWYETLGLVVLEAAAQGIPSLVPDTSAASGIVEDGVTGLHFRGGDEDDLRAKLRLMADPVLASALGRAAYDAFWARSYASLDTHVEELETIYAELLQERAVNKIREGPFCLIEGAA